MRSRASRARGSGASRAAAHRRTTSTTYDGTFHALPVQVTPAIAALAETASYDYRMGTLTSVTDANGQTTAARAPTSTPTATPTQSKAAGKGGAQPTGTPAAAGKGQPTRPAAGGTVRDSVLPPGTTSTLIYLHGDQLGSVSTVTSASGAQLSMQEFDPWGKIFYAGVGQTRLSYTGQQRDDTGLLYYHARYYDPRLARFISPDSIVPGASSGVGGAGGTVGAWQNSVLTTDFHEPGFISALSGENSVPLAWRDYSGPANPQALNRFSYVLNNPLRYTDPTGHMVEDDGREGGTAGDEPYVPIMPGAPESYKQRYGDDAMKRFGADTWGRGKEGAEKAIKDVENMSDEEFEKWARERGMTPEYAEEWRKGYEHAENNKRGSETARERQKLMELIKARWKRIGEKHGRPDAPPVVPPVVPVAARAPRGATSMGGAAGLVLRGGGGGGLGFLKQ